MDRYSIIHHKDPREMVLLKSYSCKWGRCSFCDYIDDNTTNLEEMLKVNEEALSKVSGIYKKLDVTNSGSTFELPTQTLELIRDIAYEKGIKTLILEVYLGYKNRFDELREFFKGIDIEYRIGVETFDKDFRENVLNKKMPEFKVEELAELVYSICLMVGIKGQTREMIDRDIELSKHFKRVAINLFRNNTTNIKRDEELVNWFKNKYQYLVDDSRYDVLFEPTDFGVGD